MDSKEFCKQYGITGFAAEILGDPIVEAKEDDEEYSIDPEDHGLFRIYWPTQKLDVDCSVDLFVTWLRLTSIVINSNPFIQPHNLPLEYYEDHHVCPICQSCNLNTEALVPIGDEDLGPVKCNTCEWSGRIRYLVPEGA